MCSQGSGEKQEDVQMAALKSNNSEESVKR